MALIGKAPAPLRNLPVLVAGGGLGGFTAALSLHRNGIPNNIVISQPKFTQDSQNGVFIGGGALRILDRLGLGSQYRTLGMPISNGSIEDIQGKKIVDFQFDKLGTQVWAVRKPNLQQLFLEALPPDSVHFGTKFQNLTTGKSGVQVQIQKTSGQAGLLKPGQSGIIETRFVIGADGMNSTVRMFMSRPVMTVASGVSIWRAIAKNRDLKQYPFHISKEIWDRNRRFGFTRISPDEVMWWAIVSDIDDIILRPFGPHLLRLFSKFTSYVPDLVSSMVTDRDIHRLALRRSWPERSPWIDEASNRIGLVGDAGRPGNNGNFHTGASFAVEDGYLLAAYLADQNERGRLEFGPHLHEYETNREENVSSISVLSSRFNKLSKPQSFIDRYFLRRLLQFSMNSFSITKKTQTGLPSTRLE